MYLEEVHSSALAHPARRDQASRRRRRGGAEHRHGDHSTPIPFRRHRPCRVIALISLAYLEEDGLLLSIALLAAVIVLIVELVVVWGTILGAKWIIGFW